MASQEIKAARGKLARSTPFVPPSTEDDVRVRVFSGHQEVVYRVAMPADGRFALTSSYDRTVRSWTLTGGGPTEAQPVGEGELFFGLAVTADGSRAAAGNNDGKIQLIEIDTGRVSRHWKAHDDAIGNLAFHAEGRELLSASHDGYLRRWNARTGVLIAECRVPFGKLFGVAASADGHRIVGAKAEEGLALWTGVEGVKPVIFQENVAGQSPISVPADGNFAFTGTNDGTVAKWDLTEGRRVAAFEGHSGAVFAVAVTPDARFCISGGYDGTVRLWAADTGQCLAILRGHPESVYGIAITPDARRIASVSNDRTLRVWDIPEHILARAATSRKRGYLNAKVVLLGDSGVGKSGLALRLWHDRWEKTESSHGMEIQRLVLPEVLDDDHVVREVWLWDLAGQPDYRLTHQLFMEQTALAVLVFDPQKPDLFETLGYWQSALARVALRQDVPGILVAARCDRPGLRITLDEVREWGAARKLSGPVLTAAKLPKHPGAAELRALIEELLPWDQMEFRSTMENFPALKDAILGVRDAEIDTPSVGVAAKEGPDGSLTHASGVVVTTFQLEARVREAAPHLVFTPEDLRAVTGLLAGEGVLYKLPYGGLVVLQPNWVNCYASTLVKLAGEAENKLGNVPLQTVQPGRLYPDGMPRLSIEDEQQLLPALLALFLGRALAWKQETDKGTMLVFPNYVRLPRPLPPPRPGSTVVYRFTGPLEEIYCTLVVRLHHSGLFTGTKLYRQAVDFETATGKLAALTMKESGECGELEIYFSEKLDGDVQAAFQQFVHDHLVAKAKNVDRLRNYFCPKCKEEVSDRRAIDAALFKNRTKLVCNYCDPDDAGIIILIDVLEKQFSSKEGDDKAHIAGRRAGVEISTASMEQVMVGEVMAIVASVNQAFIPRVVRDEGTDGEIEFFATNGDSTGVSYRVQLKSGDSHLKKRADGTEVFAMKKHYKRYWAGKGTVPVLLIIRASDGRIRYMNATSAIRAAVPNNSGRAVKHLVFTGQDFTKEAVLRLRDERLK